MYMKKARARVKGLRDKNDFNISFDRALALDTISIQCRPSLKLDWTVIPRSHASLHGF